MYCNTLGFLSYLISIISRNNLCALVNYNYHCSLNHGIYLECDIMMDNNRRVDVATLARAL